MAILLLAEHDNASLNDQTVKALSAANRIGGDVPVLVAGSGAKAAANAAAKLSGVSKVLLADDAGSPTTWRNRLQPSSSRSPAPTT